MIKVLFVFGTRPEAIKLCPLVLEQRARPREFEPRICVTAQHRGMLDQVLAVFGVQPHHDLDVMTPGQTLASVTARMLAALEPVFRAENPDLAIVQGDTTTTLCGALAAFYHRVPVAHVEAGLRTFNPASPFPEEMNRLLTGRLAALHFAPTAGARGNLLREGVAEDSVFVTGNTGIDAVLSVRRRIESGTLQPPAWEWLRRDKRLILVTAHRRESFGGGFERICQALARLASREDVQLVYPVHPNPNVREPVERLLGGHPSIRLIEPLDYLPFVDLMRRAYLIVTDSGGVQEEAPSLGKPVLVLRDTTERPEAVEAGTVELTGTDPERIVEAGERLLDHPDLYRARTLVHNPYGDGCSSARICGLIHSYFNP